MGRHLVGLLALPFALTFASCEPQERERPPGGGVGMPNTPPTTGNTPAPTSGRSLPPLSGGTLLVLSDPDLAVVSEPDLNRVFVVRLSGGIVHEIALEDGAEPGRAVEDAAGNVHVVLRNKNAVLTVDPGDGETRTTPVCLAPRGIGYDAASDSLYVACALGSVSNIAASDGMAIKTFELEPDLRDVVINGDHIFISKFRSAEVLLVSHDGEIKGRKRPASTTDFTSTVAWRMAPFQDGVVMAHQRSADREIDVSPEVEDGVYQGGGSCDSALVQAAVTTFSVDDTGALTSRTTSLSTL
ncbi:MAG: hypothetical protein HOV80_29375, partial [Polyangiaceae bacterium]|nr:hypothetical protein [Polyangiaceae bacterium]